MGYGGRTPPPGSGNGWDSYVRSTGYYGSSGLMFGYKPTTWVKRLIIANVAMFVVAVIVGSGRVTNLLAFQPNHLLTRPWGVFTYMFVHGSPWHLFMNMLMLFFFGPSLEARWGSREFLKYYLICGLGGVALSFLLAPSASIIGASAAVYGVMLAFAFAWPEVPIYVWGIFPVKVKWLVTFLFAVSFLSAFGGATDGVAHFAHLGGFLVGFLYLKADWRPTERLEAIKKATKKRRMAVVSGGKAPKAGAAGEGRGEGADERRILDAVDRVLDKISAEGMSALTPEERKLLDEVSRRRRSN